MQIKHAVELINHRIFSPARKQIWCDLGCGAGTFTLALANLLAPESLIYAIDKNKSVLGEIPESYNNVSIKKIERDFTDADLNLPATDGILMANSLHFVKDKKNFLRRIENLTQSFLIVEYENRKPNRWVPFPVDFQNLAALFSELNYSSVEKINSRKSAFGGEIYAATAIKFQSVKSF